MRKKIEYIMDIGYCPMGVVEESLARDACSWKSGWTIGFTDSEDNLLCTEDTSDNLGMSDAEFLDLAVEVGGRTGMYLRCYPCRYDENDVKCLKDLFFKKKNTAIRFLKKLEEHWQDTAR